MGKSKRSIASKMIGAFATSALFAAYFVAAFPNPEGGYVFFLPAFFIVFAFITFIAFPLSLLVDRISAALRHAWVAIVGYILSGVVLALLCVWVDDILTGYALAILYVYFFIVYLISLLERKYRMNPIA